MFEVVAEIKVLKTQEGYYAIGVMINNLFLFPICFCEGLEDLPRIADALADSVFRLKLDFSPGKPQSPLPDVWLKGWDKEKK